MSETRAKFQNDCSVMIQVGAALATFAFHDRGDQMDSRLVRKLLAAQEWRCADPTCQRPISTATARVTPVLPDSLVCTETAAWMLRQAAIEQANLESAR